MKLCNLIGKHQRLGVGQRAVCFSEEFVLFYRHVLTLQKTANSTVTNNPKSTSYLFQS